MAFKFTSTNIPGVLTIEPNVHKDSRGFFMETYKMSEFNEAGIAYDFVQDNHSMSSKGVLRGLHYQLKPKEQGKLVRVVSGSIYDVALDIRKGSETYGKFFATTISAEDKRMMWIPPGLAHGFLSLEDSTEILYKTTAEYDSKLDRGILWNDPALKIPWPDKEPIISDKDKRHPTLREAELELEYESEKKVVSS